MIVNEIVHILCEVVEWFLHLLPLANMGQVSTAISSAGYAVGVMRALNEYVPVSEAITAATIYIGVYVAIHGFNAIRRVWSLIWPGAGG